MKAPVAAAGGAVESTGSTFLSCSHELTTPIHSMPSHASRVVLPALPIPHLVHQNGSIADDYFIVEILLDLHEVLIDDDDVGLVVESIFSPGLPGDCGLGDVQ